MGEEQRRERMDRLTNEGMVRMVDNGIMNG